MNATHVQRPVKAALMMLGSSALITLMTVFARLASQHHAIIEVTFFRNLVGAICMFVFVASDPRGFAVLKTSRKGDHLIRTIVGLIGLCLNFYAVKLLPLAEQTALFFAMPLMLTLLAIPLLREHVDWRRWVGVALGFIGILIIARPTGNLNGFGVLIALSGAFFTALVAINVRRLGTSEPEIRTVFYFFTLSTIIAACFLPWYWTTPSFETLVYLVGSGLAGTLGQILLTKAYAEAPAAFLSPFNYVAIVYSTFFGWLLWGEWPHTAVFVGASIVISAGFMTLYLEKTRNRNEILPQAAE
ncbi:MAG: DMT family transporter [Alphaproteobacteria bacterium]|nr:DMT family transporter [Alphaproteobacteria bacterium]